MSQEQQVIFNKATARAFVVVMVFSIITTIATVFQNHRVDALEKRVEVIEGRR